MKILTIRQPWAGLIVTGLKDVENRTKPWRHVGPLLILAGKSVDDAATAEYIRRRFHVKRLPKICHATGGIIGMTFMYGCSPMPKSIWFEGPYGYLLKDSRELPFVAYRGTLSAQHAPMHLIAQLGLLS